MNRFASVLTKINQKISLPQPEKSRILLEIAGDLNDLYEAYLQQGFNEKEAKQKAELKFDLDEDALNELVQIHKSGYNKFLDKLSKQAQMRWERLGSLIVLMAFFIPSAYSIVLTDFFTNASFFTWLILSFAGCNIILFLIKFYILYIKKDHHSVKLYFGLNAILYLGVLSLLITLYGYFVELYSLSGNAVLFGMNPFLLMILNTSKPQHAEILNSTTLWLIRNSAMVMTGMLVAIVSGLMWYLLKNKVTRIEIAESSFLLKE